MSDELDDELDDELGEELEELDGAPPAEVSFAELPHAARPSGRTSVRAAMVLRCAGRIGGSLSGKCLHQVFDAPPRPDCFVAQLSSVHLTS
jgi:hypothetical protein